MNDNFKNFVKFGIKFPKDNVVFPKNWNKLTSSNYNNEENYAILTGKINDIIVIDLDIKNNNKDSINWFELNFGYITEINTFATKSINGGYHVYFKYNSKINNIANKTLHIDILSDNRCCYQGKWYDIINSNNIREFSNEEIKSILALKVEVQKNGKNSYNKANKLLKMPDNTDWKLILTDQGHKAIADCDQCIVNPCKNHSDPEHSALFFNKDKSVIKSCYSCGNEIVNKKQVQDLANSFNIILNTQENTSYQKLVNTIIDFVDGNYLREKNTGYVYKKIKSYAFKPYLNAEDFINEVLLDNDLLMSSPIVHLYPYVFILLK